MRPLILDRLANLGDYILDIGEKYPQKTAIIQDARHHTYAELISSASSLAFFLRSELGLNKGDRVLIYTKNSIEHVVSVLACIMSGTVFVPINHNIKKFKLEFILGDIQPSAVVTDSKNEEITLELFAREEPIRGIILIDQRVPGNKAAGKFHDLETIRSAGYSGPAGFKVIDYDLASVIYTSGSSGFPKGVMLTHLNMVTAASAIISYLELNPDDRIICALPFPFDYGMYQFLMSCLLGSTVVIADNFGFIGDILNTLQRERCTVFPVIPTIVSLLMTRGNLDGDVTASIRTITNTGAAIDANHISYLKENFKNARIFSMYGLTECKRVSYLPPDQIEKRPGSIGRGMPNEEVFLVDEAGRILPYDSTGELVVRGNNIMRGYWNNPKETGKFLRLGNNDSETWLYTGDIFRTDADGYLYFIGRKDDIIKSHGEKVSPVEIELLVKRIPGIHEVAAIGTPDTIAGAVIHLYVSLSRSSGLDIQSIMQMCKKNLEPHMVPKKIVIMDELPKNENGKIDKRSITEQNRT